MFNHYKYIYLHNDRTHWQKLIVSTLVISSLIFNIFNPYEALAQTGVVYYVDDDAPNDSGDGSMNNPKKYITSAIQLMNGGDTLIIKDGVYTGANNMIGDYASPQVWPPSGLGPNQYTVIKAENVSGAIIDGEYRWAPFSTFNRMTKVNYVRVEGIHFRRGSCGVFNIKGDYNKIIRSGFEDGQSPTSTGECPIAFIAGGSSYSLVEDSWVWGKGRYGIFTSATSGTGGSNHVIFRRVVVRTDETPPKWVSGGINFYWADTNVCQNCIVTDSTPNSLSVHHGAFYMTGGSYAYLGAGSINHSYYGSIALNNKYWWGFFPEHSRNVQTIENTIFWDQGKNGWGAVSSSEGMFNVNHISSGFNGDGSLYSSGFWSRPEYPTVEDVTNSISVNNSEYGLSYIGNPNTLNVYGNTMGACNNCTIINAKTTNPFTAAPGYSSPALKYLPRIEANSNLKGAATDGGDIGATILKKIGVSGTLYGEPGWDQTTNEDLWPWPDEDIWTPKLRAYNASGPGGNRGFAAAGTGLYGGPITLTSYIWEYLGNPLPEEIAARYNPGTIPPQVTSRNPSSGATGVAKDTNISFHIVDQQEGVNLASVVARVNGVTVYDGANPLNYPDTTVSGTPSNYLISYNPPTDFDPYEVVTATIDATDLHAPANTMTQVSYSFTISDYTPPTAPSGLAATPLSASQIDLVWNAAGDSESGIASYNIYRNNIIIGTATATSFSDTGLAEAVAYTYEVSAVNGAGLESPRSTPVSAATLTDTTPPTIISISASGNPTEVFVVFSEPVGETSATELANYSIDKGIAVSSASLAADLKTVTLTTSPLSEGLTYTLTINNVKDRATIPNTIASNSQATFTFVSGLVGLWKFDGGSGTVANDSSGNDNTGTLINGPTWTTGKIGGAISFDGANDRVDTTNFMSSGVTQFTLQAWVYKTATKDARIVYKNNAGNISHPVFGLASGSNDLIRCRLRVSDGTGVDLSAGTIPLNTWTFAACVYDGSSMVVYKDGTEAGRTAKTGTLAATNDIVVIGQNETGTSVDRHWPGMIDDVRIYDRALNQSEIQELYNLGSAPTPDATPPSTPTGLAAQAISSTQINLSWTASTDNVGIAGYKIYRDGTLLITQNSPLTTFSDIGLQSSTTYAYTVSAYDAAGNESVKSSAVSATTKAPADTTPPARPRGFRIK